MAIAPAAWAAPTVYVSNFGGNSISAYSVGAGGGLSQISGSPFSTGATSQPYDVTISPDASHLFVANSHHPVPQDVAPYSIGADGSLSATSGSAPAGNYPLGVALTPDGSHLYATNYNDGTVSAYSVAADGALTAVAGSPFPDGANTNPITVAVTPDGRYLYVGNFNNGMPGSTLSGYSIGANGALTQLSGSPFATDNGPEALIVSPDGKYIYSANANSTTVSGFSIGADGELTPVTGSPFSAGTQPIALAITPDGSHLYAANIHSNNVSAYSVAANGSLTQLAGSPYPTGTSPEWTAVTPDGHYLYVTDQSGVSAYTIGAAGDLSSVAGSPFPAGAGATGIAITPDQGPVAAFSATAAPAGATSAFDGSASHDPDETVARYDWNFGDGTTASNAGATPTHTYAAAGTYTVTLTVTDDVGCSTTQIFTGQMALCNGGPAAQTSETIVVAPPSITKLHVSPHAFALTGRKVKGRCVVQTKRNRGHSRCRRSVKFTIRYTTNVAATVTITIERVTTGRKAGGRCVKRTGKNHRHKRCTLDVPVRGKIVRAASDGANSFVFNGRIGGHALGPGTYKITITPSVDGRAGTSRSAKFKITS